MTQPIKFWDKHAEGYSKRPVDDEESYQKKLQITRDYFRPDMEVLEFGCGTGTTAISHAPFVKHILATDISPKMLGIAQAKADADDIRNVKFKQAEIDVLNITDQSFDAIMGHSILHLVEDPDAIIAKVYSMLKPSGVFISSTGCLGDSMKWFKLVGPIGKFLGLLPTVKVFSTQELIDSHTRAGFEIDHQWKPEKGVSVFIVAKKAS
jgi:ubiquinone/menaquinone biosynthesis C-methylase UbiE